MVGQFDSKWRRFLGIDGFAAESFQADIAKRQFRQDAGNGDERTAHGENKIEQIIPGVDRAHAYGKGKDDKTNAFPGQL